MDQLMKTANRYGYTGIALTDENNLFGAWELFDKADEHNLHPILGVILSDAHHSLIALVENERGYSNLCRLITQKHLDGNFQLEVALEDMHDGLLFLVRNPDFAKRILPIIPRTHLWLECCRPMPKSIEPEMWDLSRRQNIPIVGTTNVFYAEKEETGLYQLLTAVRRNCRVDVVSPLPQDNLYHLPSPEFITSCFSDCPDVIQETIAVAERCQFRLSGQRRLFPTIDKAQRTLEQEVAEGVIRRFGKSSPEIEERLNEELSLLNEMGYADYFLVVADIVSYARSIGTPVAGRGSGAHSLVAYCLGITNVDPLSNNLPFARFLNRSRTDFPDLDLDFCWRKRDDIIDYVFRTYGDDHVAMVSTMSTLKPRAAFRVAAKALGYSTEATTRMQRVLSTASLEDLNNPIHPCWQAMGIHQKQVNHLISQSQLLFDRPHHLSLHPGGILISPDMLSKHVPLQRSAKGVVLSQYDKEGVKRLGLIKIDLLGNRSVSAAGEAIQLIQKRHAREFDVEKRVDSDAETAKLLMSGDTLGIGQLESPLIRQFLKQLRVTSPPGIMQALALVRPGPAALGLKETFLARARGEEGSWSPETEVESLLADTYGMLLFEDDALRVIGALTGMKMAEADTFRKQIGRCKGTDERKQLSNAFLSLCEANGSDMGEAKERWVQMSMFNGYSFCRGHAASYAQVAWFNAFIKAHYPLEFWVTALNNMDGFYDKWVYVEEAKRQGIRVLKPCVNGSQTLCTAEGGSIRLGLMQIRGLSKPTMRSILKNRPFVSLEDLCQRMTVNSKERRALTLCGAAPSDESSSKRPHPEQFRYDWEILGLSVNEHPVHHFRNLLQGKGYCLSSELNQYIGRPVKLCGIPATSRSFRGRDGKDLCFFTLSDEDGLFEVTLPTDVYESKKLALAQSNRSVFCVTGIPDIHYNSISVRAQDIRPLKELLSSLLRTNDLEVG